MHDQQGVVMNTTFPVIDERDDIAAFYHHSLKAARRGHPAGNNK